MADEPISPVGSPISQDIERWEQEDPVFRAERDRLRPYREIARVLILLRTRQQISQDELAHRVGTSKSAIARLESGRHKPSMETLRRVAEAFGGQLNVTIEVPAPTDHTPSPATVAP